MTDKDKKRIDKSYDMDCIEWSIVQQWSDEADDEEARRILDNRASTMYHEEEYEIGLL